jgi:hypothetical protein
MIYFQWLQNLQYDYPPEMLKPIRQAVIGFVEEIKDNIVIGFSSAYEIIRGRSLINYQYNDNFINR